MRKSTALLSVAAFAGATISLWLVLELRAERALNAELNARMKQVSATRMAAPTPAPVPLVSPQAHTSTPQAPVAAMTITNSAASQTARRTPMTGEEWMARQRQMMKDPRYREAWYEQQRLQMTGRRERLKDVLRLSDEQADAVIDLSIDRQMSWQFQTAPNPMTEESMREQRERMETARLAEQTRLREVLGEAKYAKYEEYLETGPSRQQVDRLRSELSGADALRDDQVEPLIAAMHAEQAQMVKDMQAYRESLGGEGDQAALMLKTADQQTEAMKASQTRIRTAAGAILTYSQLEHLDAMLKRDIARHETQVRMQRIQSKLEPPPEPQNAN